MVLLLSCIGSARTIEPPSIASTSRMAACARPAPVPDDDAGHGYLPRGGTAIARRVRVRQVDFRQRRGISAQCLSARSARRVRHKLFWSLTRWPRRRHHCQWTRFEQCICMHSRVESWRPVPYNKTHRHPSNRQVAGHASGPCSYVPNEVQGPPTPPPVLLGDAGGERQQASVVKYFLRSSRGTRKRCRIFVNDYHRT